MIHVPRRSPYHLLSWLKCTLISSRRSCAAQEVQREFECTSTMNLRMPHGAKIRSPPNPATDSFSHVLQRTACMVSLLFTYLHTSKTVSYREKSVNLLTDSSQYAL